MSGPHKVPVPPTRHTVSVWTMTSTPKTASGVTMNRMACAYTAPTMAAGAALSMYAAILHRKLSTPAASAACSFSRIARSQ